MESNFEYAPLEFMKDGQMAGFDYDLVNEIGRRLGVTVSWTNQPFAVLLTNVNHNQDNVDMAISALSMTSSREKEVSFSSPTFCMASVILSRSGGPTAAKDLNQYLVGAEIGSIAQNYLKKLRNPPRIFPETSTEVAISDIVNRKTDATILEYAVALEVQRNNPQAKLQIGDSLWKTATGIAFAKSSASDELRQAVNKALADMLRDGTYKNLSQKYFGRDIRC